MKIEKNSIYNYGFIKIKPTINNIFITLTDVSGNVIISKHAGLINYKGSKKRTPYVAGQVMKSIIKDVLDSNIIIKALIVQVHGFLRNPSMYSIMDQLNIFSKNNNLTTNVDSKYNIIYIDYVNKKAHGTMRLKKQRRL